MAVVGVLGAESRDFRKDVDEFPLCLLALRAKFVGAT